MNSKSLRQISSLSISTTGSRILGLVRDATFFSYFGTSLLGSAFIIAFTIPNLFRRLLGEGALSSAFLPVFSKKWNESESSGFQLLNQILSRLILYFGGSIAIAATLLVAVHRFSPLPEKWDVTLPMLALLLPYAVAICIAAIITAALNAIGKFFLASLSPILLNLSMIAALIVGGQFWESESEGLAYALSAGVLLGGILQMLLPAVQMMRNRWKPRPDLSSSDDFSRVKQLFWTATGGAAILQVNILITRLIAYQHSDEAVSQLYLSSRLTELPLGVFAVAIYTVLFPLLSKHAANDDTSAFSDTCSKGVVMTLGITIPAAIGLMMLADPILSLLFEWGRFSDRDVALTAPILAIYSISIPFYALISYLTRIFHSQQNMKAPVRVSAMALILNVVLSIALMIAFDVKGLASATVITAVCQFTMLCLLLSRQSWMTQISGLWSQVIRILIASLLMGAVVLGVKTMLPLTADTSRLSLLLSLSAIICAGVASYAVAVLALGLRSSFTRPSNNVS